MPDPHNVDLLPENEVLRPIPVAEVTKCLKLIAEPGILRVREEMAFKTAMSMVADAFEDQTDLRVQIIKSLCDAFDFQD